MKLTSINKDVRDRFEEIARAEIQRQRRKMDLFTPAQLRAVEELVLATANEISGRVSEKLERYPEERRAKYSKVWSVQAA